MNAARENHNSVLLQVEDLRVHFPIRQGTLLRARKGAIRAVDGVSLEVHAGETLGLVGESGCGKSTLARAVTRLERIDGGRVVFDGRDITRLSGNALRRMRRHFQMIFQDPYASLNPRMTVGQIVAEPLRVFGSGNGNGSGQGKSITRQVRELLEIVGLDKRYENRYPHEFSGGQRQRIGIARALALRPRLIVADEPVSALDVSVQAQIVNLMQEIQKEFGVAYLFIAHDLSVVKHISDRVAVMYLGRIAETAPAADIYDNPKHPYTRALLSAVPIPDPDVERERRRIILTGDVPSPDREIPGCPFYPRCPHPKKDAECTSAMPPLAPKAPNHRAACVKEPDFQE